MDFSEQYHIEDDPRDTRCNDQGRIQDFKLGRGHT